MDVEEERTRNVLSAPQPDFQEAEEEEEGDLKGPGLGQNSRRAYMRELRKVVGSADVILHVLDARDPDGTRSRQIEEMVLSHAGKKLVYVLNKADLVPRDVLAGWLAHLRLSHPAVPFKCNTQTQRSHLGYAGGKVGKSEGALLGSQSVGAEELLSLLKNYSRAGEGKSVISVGCVGFPNVGKSSLVNSLLRHKAVGVSPVPGFTRVSQEVVLDKNVRLIDSPGIVFADGDGAAVALRNCVNVDCLADVTTPIQAILDRCPAAYLMQLYCVPRFKDCASFLTLVARATGKLKKGGVPNTDAAARGVLHDWNTGKIKYYCKPPKRQAGGLEGSQILDAFSTELDVDGMQEVRVLAALGDELCDYVSMDEVAGALDGAEESVVEAVVSMEEEREETRSRVSTRSTRSKTAGVAEEEAEGRALNMRKTQKESKKRAVKDSRRGKEAYDFDKDFE